jgi:protease-4
MATNSNGWTFMSIDALIDRQRLRRKLTFWRILALAIAAIAIISGIFMQIGDSSGRSGDHIAKLRIEGTIVEDEALLERIEEIRTSQTAKAVIVTIDSPGGTTAGGEAIFDAIRKLAADKPVVAQVGTLAASAGYMIASATDHIVARQSSIVGSIGVLIQFPNFSQFMERNGIIYESIKSSALKAEPSPFNETTPDERAMIGRLISDSYDWFVDLVAERRKLPRGDVLKLADGSVFTGRQGLANKLVDALGGEEAALAWLKTRDIDGSLNVIEWKSDVETGPWSLLLGKADQGLGASALVSEILRQTLGDTVFLDGLVSVWQPSARSGPTTMGGKSP